MATLPDEFAEALALDQTIADRVSQSQESALEDLYQLELQVRLARQVLADRMKGWLAIRKAKPELAMGAAEIFHVAQKDYLDIVAKCEAINRSQSDVFDIHTVFAIVKQMERIIERELKHSPDVDITLLKRAIAAEVTIPGRGADNEAVESPAKIASFMDFTVPGEN